MNEYSIMSDGLAYFHNHIYRWYGKRLVGTVRHEIFFGSANRKKSIQYGIVVFILPEDHNMSVYGVHNFLGKEFNDLLKAEGQRTAMAYYGWSEDEFRKVFGRSYI